MIAANWLCRPALTPSLRRPAYIRSLQPRRLVPASWYSSGPRRVCRLPANELLSTLDAESVGAVLIDPPPDIGVGNSDRDYALDEQIAALTDVAEQTFRVLRQGGVAIALGGARAITAWDVAASWSGMSLLSEMFVVWDRPAVRRPRAVANLPSLAMAVRRYVKPGWRETFNADTAAVVQSNVLVCQQVPDIHRYTYCQRPVELFNYLISTFTNTGDFIVDPMCGVGSSLVAAELNGRDWLGGDIELRCVEVARERVRAADVEELGKIGYWYGHEVHYI